ncbi:MAG: hypothetical protein RI993_2086 [Pseudomonadota bacterium]
MAVRMVSPFPDRYAAARKSARLCPLHIAIGLCRSALGVPAARSTHAVQINQMQERHLLNPVPAPLINPDSTSDPFHHEMPAGCRLIRQLPETAPITDRHSGVTESESDACGLFIQSHVIYPGSQRLLFGSVITAWRDVT